MMLPGGIGGLEVVNELALEGRQSHIPYPDLMDLVGDKLRQALAILQSFELRPIVEYEKPLEWSLDPFIVLFQCFTPLVRIVLARILRQALIDRSLIRHHHDHFRHVYSRPR